MEIDGAGPGLEGYEAGGQILRVALALSPILGKPFRMTNIRAGRPKPGLQPQHLTGVRAIAEITGAEVEGDAAGSKEIAFGPSDISGGEYIFDTGTAGSVTLLAQSILPVLLFADRESRVVLRGGTHVAWSPTIDYYGHVLIPLVRKFGADVEMKINRYGWYPRGGGEIELAIKPSRLRAVDLTERGRLKAVRGVCALSNLREDIAAREVAGIRETFMDADIETSAKPAASPGTAVTVWAEYDNTVLGAEELGKIGKRAEDVGKEAAARLAAEMSHGAVLDSHMTDQLLIFMALAEGKSRATVPAQTPHARTCTWLIPIFTGRSFEIDKNTIATSGIGAFSGPSRRTGQKAPKS